MNGTTSYLYPICNQSDIRIKLLWLCFVKLQSSLRFTVNTAWYAVSGFTSRVHLLFFLVPKLFWLEYNFSIYYIWDEISGYIFESWRVPKIIETKVFSNIQSLWILIFFSHYSVLNSKDSNHAKLVHSIEITAELWTRPIHSSLALRDMRR